MGVASLVLSIIGAFFALIGLIPLLGSINYFALFLLTLALIFGSVAMIKKNGIGIAGFIVSLIFIIIASWRLYIGSGIV